MAQVRLSKTAKDMVDDVKAMDVEQGRPEPSDAYVVALLIQHGYAALKAKDTKKKVSR